MNVISKVNAPAVGRVHTDAEALASLPVFRTVYRFGTIDTGHLGHIVLGETGVVRYYKRPADARFRFDGALLRFTDAAGNETARLRYFPDANCFFADDRSRFYLLPVLERDKAAPVQGFGPPVMINSIPKSGTYLMEAVAQRLGGVPLRVHLSAQSCDDYRQVPEFEMHRHPAMHRVAAPGGAVAHLLRPGDVAVGHVNDTAELDEFTKTGTRMLHCIRDLRGVLVSLYRFKKARVAPVCDDDAAWRALDDEAGFLGFLRFNMTRDIAFISSMAEAILSRAEPIFRFEDALRGAVPDDVAALLGRDACEQALQAVQGRATSTYSGGTVHYGRYWNAAVETLFQNAGLVGLNRKLGYLG